MPIRKACAVSSCIAYAIEGGSRCKEHAIEIERPRAERKARNRRLRFSTGAQSRLRAVVNRVGHAVCVCCYRSYAARFIQIDHKIPLADGGTDTDENVQPLCTGCHKRKTIEENRERHREGRAEARRC